MFPLLGFVWVEFDVENGPCVRDTFYGFNNHKTTYEPSEVLSATAKDFIAFHAMPDSTSVSSEISKMEESLFFFHVPCNLLCETELASYFWNDSGPCQGNFCYQAVQPVAHSLFRVTANQKARRGYDQSAIVAVCTTNVSTSFIRALLYIVAGKLFQEGTLSKNEMEKELGFLRHQFLQIMSGNEEKENSVRNCVKFLATELIVSGDYVLCPCGLTRQWCIHTVQFSDEESNLCSSMKTRDFPIIPLVKPNCNIPFFHEFDLYRCFSENLGYLWTLLELMMLGESILVVSSTPSQACSTVGCLLSLLVPLLPVDVNWQSYFIIQASCFSLIILCFIECTLGLG